MTREPQWEDGGGRYDDAVDGIWDQRGGTGRPGKALRGSEGPPRADLGPSSAAAEGVVSLFAKGRPAPQGSKRALGPGRMVEMSKYVKPWRAAVEAAALAAYPHRPKLDGPLWLDIVFYLTRPKRPVSNRPDRVPDLSKLIRSTEDALVTAGLIHDDARVVDVRASKVYAVGQQATGALIEVRRV